MKLWLLRHAQVLVAPGVCYGVSEVQADAQATAQAAQAFAPHPAQGCVLWTSPAQRAQQLAQALQGLRPDLCAPQVQPPLREMDFGCWEMQAWTNIPRAALDAWTADFAHHRFGGQESAQAVVARVAGALVALRAQGVPEAVWVTHAGVMRALQFLLAGQPPRLLASAQDWPLSAPAMGGWMALEV